MARVLASAVGGEVFTIAPTGSMKPTLDESSVVTIERVSFTSLQRGDIVIYKSARGEPVIHRLYKPVSRGWMVLGDNNGSIDAESVSRENFIGRVCAIFYTSASDGAGDAMALARK